jgi:two-component sensor histidine kinase
VDVPDPFKEIEGSRILAQAIVDTIREPLLVLDKDLRVVAASRSFYLTFRMKPEEVLSRPIYALGNGQWDLPELRLLLEQILPKHTVMDGYEVEQEFAPLGRRTMVLNARAVFSEKNTLALILLAIEDITDRRTAERGLADLLQQKETLLSEMQHRVANSLQIIASILLLKARTVQSEEIKLHLHDAHRRVMSVASVQQHLQASRHGEHLPIAPYLTRLCETLATSMIGEGHDIKIEVQAGEGEVTSTEAVSIGLIVTELVINALKHAFTESAVGGRIVVSHEVSDKAWSLAVSDNGVGKAEGADDKTTPGLGTSIVQSLAKQLGCRVETSKSVPHGMTVAIVHGAFPAAQLPAAA